MKNLFSQIHSKLLGIYENQWTSPLNNQTEITDKNCNFLL